MYIYLSGPVYLIACTLSSKVVRFCFPVDHKPALHWLDCTGFIYVWLCILQACCHGPSGSSYSNQALLFSQLLTECHLSTGTLYLY